MNTLHTISLHNFWVKRTLTGGLIAWLLLSALTCLAQRGTSTQNSYALSNIETINTVNGNLMFNIPLGSLPAGRNGMSAGVALHYNSKLYDSYIGTACYQDIDNQWVCTQAEQLYVSPEGGWRTGFQYKLQQYWNPNFSCFDAFKMVMSFPDGSIRTFIPYGNGPSNGYYNIGPDGYGFDSACHYTLLDSGTRTYYSTDGTYLKLEIQHDTNDGWENNPWTLSLPDGGKVKFNEPGANGLRIYDSNLNWIEVQKYFINDSPAHKIVDQFNREITIEFATGIGTLVKVPGANGQTLTWTIIGTTVYRGDYYDAVPYYSNGQDGQSFFSFTLPGIAEIGQIIAPAQAGGYQYVFAYNTPQTGEGFCELKSVTLPSADQNKAKATYTYSNPGPFAFQILENKIIQKTQKYLRQYDNPTAYDDPANYITEVSTFSYADPWVGGANTLTSPDGSVATEWSYGKLNHTWGVGLVYKSERPDGTIVERIHQTNTPQAPYLGALEMNPYLKTEFVSIKDAAGTLVKTAIKDFNYDKNGNLTQKIEYDWVNYGDVPRDGAGKPIGIPSGAVVKRVSANTLAYPTPDASDKTTVTPNAYNKPGSPERRNAITTGEVRSALVSTAVIARTEYAYDNASTTGNLTQQRNWDSTKGTLASPLTLSNSISINHSYSLWSNNNTGKLDQSTDANGNVTKFIYGNQNGAGTEMYPTQIISAFGTSLARTSNVIYAFNSGLSLQATDVDNNITSKTTYDDLGRPTLVEEGGSGSPLVFLRQTSTEYSDALRRVIVRSDKDSKADGKLISVTHSDQLGRTRLSRTIESGVADDATDETKGIKVQTRYFSGDYTGISTANPNRYTVTSNPYRADYSYNATSELTMGWTRSKADQGGREIETQFYSGTALPEPFGANTTNKGIIATYYDGEKVQTTDPAGKQRTTATDALGRLINIWEAPNNENYVTTYTYDALDSLTNVNQGGQMRSFEYTSLKRLKLANNPESGITQYTYDNSGNLLNRLDARSTPITTTYTYDALNRNTTVRYSSYPFGTSAVDRFYDNATNGKGQFHYAVSYNTETNGTLIYNYDQINSYDKLGRATSKSQNFLINQGGYTWKPFTTTATYDLAGGMTSETYPSGRTVNYAYDNAGRATSFTGNLGDSVARNYSTQITYLPAGQLTKELFGTGTALYQRLNYNTRQQLHAVRVGTYNGTTYDDNPQAAQSSQTSSWDRGMLTWRYGSDDATIWGAGGANNNGNVRYAQHWIPGANSYNDEYEYDNLNRLKQITESGNASFVQAFDYDQWGNRTINQTLTTTSADINKKLFTINTANNRYGVPSGQSGAMSYDNVGNLVSDTYTNPGSIGVLGAMEYDADNHLTSAMSGSHKYRYNADGKRVRRIIAGQGEFWMVYGIGGELVAEYNATAGIPATTAPSKEFGYRNGELLVIAEGSNPKWLIQDHLGSTRMEIGLSGASNAVTRHDYLPFGEELAGSLRVGNGYGGASNTKQKFTGYERDTETGLDFAQARYLSSIQGRFTSVDPDNAGAVVDDPQSWNAYSYVGNHPTTTTDPSGLLWAYNTRYSELHWFDGNKDQFIKQYGGNPDWQILDGQLFTATRSGTAENGQYLKAGYRYYLDGSGSGTAVELGRTPSFDAISAFALQMQWRAAATKNAIGLFAGGGALIGTGLGGAMYLGGVTVGGPMLSSVTEGLLGDSFYFNMSVSQINQRLISAAQRELVKKLFGSEIKGVRGVEQAKAALSNFKLPQGITKEALEAYREVAKRAVLNGNDAAGIQAVRLKIIEQALKFFK